MRFFWAMLIGIVMMVVACVGSLVVRDYIPNILLSDIAAQIYPV